MSDAGRLLESVQEIDYAVQNFKVGWDEVTAEQAIGLRILKEERNRHQQEMTERPR